MQHHSSSSTFNWHPAGEPQASGGAGCGPSAIQPTSFRQGRHCVAIFKLRKLVSHQCFAGIVAGSRLHGALAASVAPSHTRQLLCPRPNDPAPQVPTSPSDSPGAEPSAPAVQLTAGGGPLHFMILQCIALWQGPGPLSIWTLMGGCPQVHEGSVKPCSSGIQQACCLAAGHLSALVDRSNSMIS